MTKVSSTSLLFRFAVRTIYALLFAFLAAPANGADQREQGREPGKWSYNLELPPGDGPFPVVFVVPGCGGWNGMAFVSLRSHGRLLKQNGIGILYLDVFKPRNVQSICGGDALKNGTLFETLDAALAGAVEVAAKIAKNPKVDVKRLAFMGQSFGGNVGLVLSNKTTRKRAGIGSRPFAAVIAYYPYCRTPSPRVAANRDAYPTAWDTPLLILIGELDDWTPARYCRANYMKKGPIPPKVVIYPGAHHSFDLIGLEVYAHERGGGLKPTHAGFNESAFIASRAVYIDFLRSVFELP